jgi:hypothetical protein
LSLCFMVLTDIILYLLRHVKQTSDGQEKLLFVRIS